MVTNSHSMSRFNYKTGEHLLHCIHQSDDALLIITSPAPNQEATQEEVTFDVLPSVPLQHAKGVRIQVVPVPRLEQMSCVPVLEGCT